MPHATIDGAHLNYEIVGAKGPAMALSPGGRNPLGDMRELAGHMAAAGWRVLLHDRRNCGASDVGFDPARSEYEMWADDLAALLGRLDMRPAVIGGSSSGARLALLLALRHPDSVRALLLMRVTGGRFAVDRLIEKYYDQFARAAESGGMGAVCETEHFAARIRERPQNRAALMAMRPVDFIACMASWRRHFLAGADWPLIGTSEADLRSVRVPVCVIPGNDLTHPAARGEVVAGLIAGAETRRVAATERDVDVTPPEEWQALYPEMGRTFLAFLARRLPAG